VKNGGEKWNQGGEKTVGLGMGLGSGHSGIISNIKGHRGGGEDFQMEWCWVMGQSLSIELKKRSFLHGLERVKKDLTN